MKVSEDFSRLFTKNPYIWHYIYFAMTFGRGDCACDAERLRYGECALVVVSHDHRLVEENGFRCLRLDVDGGGGSINTTLRG